MNFFKYFFKAYIKKNIITNYKRKKIGNVGLDVLLEEPLDYGDHPEGICIESGTTILRNSRLNIYENEKNESYVIKIGKNCYIGSYFSILAKGRVIIGDNVLIASDVIIASENHGMNPELDEPYMSQKLTGKQVNIGDGCWIGEKVVILPGCSIGKKCIIGAGSVVTKSIPDFCIAVGNPAKVIKGYNFEKHMWEGGYK